MTSRKRNKYQTEPKIQLPFMTELNDESKIIKNEMVALC